MLQRIHTPWSRRLFYFLGFVFALVSAVGAATHRETPIDDEAWNLTLFHVNDIHGAFLPERATWIEGRPLVGGMEALAAHLAQERRTAAPDLMLNAGDFMTGNPPLRPRDERCGGCKPGRSHESGGDGFLRGGEP